MPKKPSKKKAAAPSKVEKRTAAQKKVAKALKKPAAAPKAEPKREIKVGGEQTTPSAGPGFSLPQEIPPQIREAYRAKFEEQQIAEIGGEIPTERKRFYEEEIKKMGTPADPEAIKAVQGETVVPEAERPLTPKPEPEPEPTPGQQAKRQAGRLPRGIGRTSVFGFEIATREEPTPKVKTQLDIARQSQKGRDISPLAPHVQATALTLARRDHDLAKSTGKEVNGISPESQTPDLVSIRGSHHERLAEVIHGYGVKEEDFNKIPGKADLPTKVKLAWSALKDHERSKRKVSMPAFSQGATHWQDPKTGKLRPLSEGSHPEFYSHEGETQALVKGKGEANWVPLKPVREGWKVTGLRGGVKAWTFVKHPAEEYKNTHQVRSLFEHLSNTLKGSFPELTGPGPSADSRRRTAERVREKFIVTRPEPSEEGAFSKRAVKDSTFTQERGRTKRTIVSKPVNISADLTVNYTRGKLKVSRVDVYKQNMKPDNITIQETSEVERVTSPKPIEPRRPKIVQEPGGRRVVRPRRRDEGKKVGYVSQPLTVGTQMSAATAELERQKRLGTFTPGTSGRGIASTVGPNGEILRSSTVSREVVPDEKALKKNPKSKKTRVKINVTPGQVDQMLPGMENYGYEQPATAPKKVKKLIPVEGPLTAGAAEAAKSGFRFSSGELNKIAGRVTIPQETIEPGTPAIPGSARPKKVEGEFAGETGLEQLQYIKKKAGLASQRALAVIKPEKPARGMAILKGTEGQLSETRNIPQQLELPGIESPGYAGAMGQQFRRVSPATRELQLKSQQGAVPGAASDLPKGVEPKKSTRSFKGRK